MKQIDENLRSYQYQGQRHYITSKPIHPGTELLVFYGEGYAEHLGLDLYTYYSFFGVGKNSYDLSARPQYWATNIDVEQRLESNIKKEEAPGDLLCNLFMYMQGHSYSNMFVDESPLYVTMAYKKCYVGFKFIKTPK